MANLQKTLDALQPYVIGIRYIDGGVAVVDAIFKDGWTLPDSEIVKKAKGNDELNYYMLFSEKEGVGIDELLEYVSGTIKANLDREKKHELLKEMVNELKNVFKTNSLTNLRRLKFTFGDEDVMPELNDFDLDIPVGDPPFDVTEQPTEKLDLANEIGLGEIKKESAANQEFPEVPLTEEDEEILEEERRAATFFELQKQNKINGITKKISSTVELPKRKIDQPTTQLIECDCGPEEACDKCIESKSL